MSVTIGFLVLLRWMKLCSAFQWLPHTCHCRFLPEFGPPQMDMQRGWLPRDNFRFLWMIQGLQGKLSDGNHILFHPKFLTALGGSLGTTGTMIGIFVTWWAQLRHWCSKGYAQKGILLYISWRACAALAGYMVPGPGVGRSHGRG